MDAGLPQRCLPICLGSDPQQSPITLDLLSSGNLIISGASGSKKSTAVENLISQVSCLSPEQVRLVLIDPKLGVEFAAFQELPHLLFPVVDDVADVPAVLQCLLNEVVRRYRLLKEVGARNFAEYHLAGSAMPALVVVVEELADLLMVQHCDKELVRLAQIGRAAGLVLVLVTQRPSADILPGLLLANLSSRVSFRCSNRTNSLLVLDSVGAETLPTGEFLIRTPARCGLTRGRGPLLQRKQVIAAIEAARELAGSSDYPVGDSQDRRPRSSSLETGSQSHVFPDSYLFFEKSVSIWRIIVREDCRSSLAALGRVRRRPRMGACLGGALLSPEDPATGFGRTKAPMAPIAVATLGARRCSRLWPFMSDGNRATAEDATSEPVSGL